MEIEQTQTDLINNKAMKETTQEEREQIKEVFNKWYKERGLTK